MKVERTRRTVQRESSSPSTTGSKGRSLTPPASGAPLIDGHSVHTRASRGVEGSGSALPHGDTIQRLFGRHDVSHVKAFTGSRAAEATQSIGAKAYATGSKIAFGESPSLHTAAHEAAHVVQQRAGVQLKGGVGKAGDMYERHADDVAQRVVQGKSAEALLDRFAPPRSHSPPHYDTIQRLSHEATDAEQAAKAPRRTVLQLLALSDDQLNVVGEKHEESTPRRPQETKYAATFSGSEHYWIEHEFRTGSGARSDIADPWQFRLEREAIEVRRAIDGLEFQLGIGEITVNALVEELKDGADYIDSMIYTLESMLGSDDTEKIDAWSLQPDQMSKYEGLLGGVTKMSKRWGKVARKFKKGMPDMVKPPGEEQRRRVKKPTTYGNYAAELEYALKGKKCLDVLAYRDSESDLQTIKEGRDQGMHEAAEARSSVRGVWKIGQNHVDRIKDRYKERSYNLMTRAEFNEDFEKWRG